MYCHRTSELYIWFLQIDLVSWHESLVYHLFMCFSVPYIFTRGRANEAFRSFENCVFELNECFA